MKLRSMIDDKKKARVREAIAKGDASIFGKKKAEPERAQPKRTKKQLSPEEQKKLDDKLLDRLRFCHFTDIIKTLIENGADPNARNGDGETALMIALRTFESKLNATVIGDISRIQMRQRHEQGIKNVEILLEAGADVNALDSRGETAWERSWGCRENIRALFEKYGATNIK